MTFSSWVRSTLAVLRKDLQIELRTRAALNALFLFSVSSLAVISATVGAGEIGPGVKAALLWVIVLFAALVGLSRSFVHEEETQTADALRLAAPPLAVLFGKLLANALLLAAVEVVVVPLFFGLLSAHCGNWPLFLLTCLLATAGLAVGSTICAVLVARAQAGSALYAVLCLPILLPLLIAAVNATTQSLLGAPLADAAAEVRILVSYLGVLATVSALLFESVWLP